jgi:hypothetical protein
MRVIKFRVWSKRYNEFCYWGFIDGGFTGPPSGRGFEGMQQIQNTSQQYTGLKDSKGVEIYEGDLLEHIYDNCLLNWVVEQNSFGGYAIVNITVDGINHASPRYTVDSPSFFIDREIIGNIHEHPNLLTSTELIEKK